MLGPGRGGESGPRESERALLSPSPCPRPTAVQVAELHQGLLEFVEVHGWLLINDCSLVGDVNSGDTAGELEQRRSHDVVSRHACRTIHTLQILLLRHVAIFSKIKACV